MNVVIGIVRTYTAKIIMILSWFFAMHTIPVGHSMHMNEAYENIYLLFISVQHNQTCWNISGDTKVILLLLGMKLCCMKFCCLLHELIVIVLSENSLIVSSFFLRKIAFANDPLVDPRKIFLPPRLVY
jgi:hypothetical protein